MKEIFFPDESAYNKITLNNTNAALLQIYYYKLLATTTINYRESYYYGKI